MTRFARVDMDSIAPLMPGDKVAGRVAAKGEHFDFKAQDHHVHSSDPIPYRTPTADEVSTPWYVDLTGKKIGRLSVLGVAVERPGDNGQRWVVRCVCGSYELRRAKAIKKALNGGWEGDDEPMCMWCGKTRKLQHGYHDQKKASAAAEAIKQAAATRDAK